MPDYRTRYEHPDPAIVEYLVRGMTPPGEPSFADRLEAIRRLARLRFSDRQIGERVGRCQRTVLRWRRKWGINGLPRGRINGATRPVDPLLPGKIRQGM